MSEKRWARGRHGDTVQSVTTAASPRSDDITARTRNYLLMMGLRVLCLFLVLVASGWLRWVFVAGAVFIPYVAVIIANAVSRPRGGELQAPAAPAPQGMAALPRAVDLYRENEDRRIAAHEVRQRPRPAEAEPQQPTSPPGATTGTPDAFRFRTRDDD